MSFTTITINIISIIILVNIIIVRVIIKDSYNSVICACQKFNGFLHKEPILIKTRRSDM